MPIQSPLNIMFKKPLVSMLRLWSGPVWCAVFFAAGGDLAAKKLDSLVVEGLIINQPAVVRNSTGLKKGAEFTGTDIQEAIQNLTRLGLFHSVDFYTVNETDSSATLIVRIAENQICESVAYVGNKKLKVKELDEKVAVKPGQVVSDQTLFENASTLKKFYEEKGFLLAEVKTELVPSKVPGNVIVRFKITEGAKVRIKTITFTGNKAFSTLKLHWQFKAKEDRWWRAGEYKEEDYRKSLDSLIFFYQDQGYLDVEVVKDSVRFADNKKDIFINLNISEGKKYFTGNFFFTGNRVLASDSLKEKIALKKGRPFARNKFEMTKYMVEDAYREEGYLWVKVTDSKIYRGDTIDVTFDVAEGRAAVVNKIDITGNKKTMEKVIRRNIRLYPGQKYRQSLMQRSIREINQLNYFNNVSPDLKPNDDGTIDLVFNVEEKDNIGQLSVGAAYSQRDGFMGTFSTSIPNFRGAGQELDLKVEYGTQRQNYAVSFREPYLLDEPVSVYGKLFYEETKYSGYGGVKVQSYGFQVGAGQRLKWPDDYFYISGTYELSRRQEYDIDREFINSNSLITIPRNGYMSRLYLTLTRDDKDLPMFPTKGSVLTLQPEIAGLGPDTIHTFGPVGAYKYMKGSLGYEWYFPLIAKFVLSSKTNFAMIRPWMGSNRITIPRLDLLSAGGVYSEGNIRGYGEESFGGRGDPARGLTLFTSSIELRYPILDQQLYMSIFGDMGNTWAAVSDIDLMDVYKGVGVGTRINVPMLGMLGFDLGWRLDDPNRTQYINNAGTFAERFELHFVMNRPF